jgi:FkbH-like protein
MPNVGFVRNAIVITASFTAEPIMPGLRYVLDEAGLDLDICFAPYLQVFQELLSPTSLLARNAGGVNVVLVRLEDFVREIANIEDARATVVRTAKELSNALSRHAHRVKVPTVLAMLAPSPRVARALLPDIDAATAAVVAHARSLHGIALVTPDDIAIVSGDERYDQTADELAHIPFTEEHYASIALAIARKVHALRVPAQKVLVLDCDETLWRGVVGEDGIEGVTIPPGAARLQEFAVKIQAQGALVCLVSKNAERDVLELFEKRSDMILKIEHIVAHRINWEPKPRNIVSLARALNLGLDSFVFLDDNPVECALVRAELPEVVTLQVPRDEEIESLLSHLWSFDKVTVTDEDSRRTNMYRENAARQELEETTTDIAEFIASLDVVIDIGPPDDGEWARVAQLTQRTNQFNFTTLRRTEPEMRALPGSGSTVLRVKVRDRFGDYGLVGLVVATPTAGALAIDTLLLSCRVLGRGVEHAILRRLGEIAKPLALAHVDLNFAPTSRNEPARAFAESVAAQFRIQEQDRIVYRIPADYACDIAHRPGHDPAAVIEARKSEESKNSASRPVASSGRAERYAKLAQTLVSGRSVLEAARACGARSRTLPGIPEPPVTATERGLLALWQELLGINGLGVEDDYFALGGTSLMAARLFTEISRRFGARLPLTTILGSSTVRALSRQLDQQRNPRSGALIELRPGGPRNLFFVHDGDGETLLYLNIARRMPAEFSVFGIEPRRDPGVPLAHVRIEDMAAFYIEEVRKKQDHGPYIFAGMCAGGVIAYEMASQLERAGESVELVALLDAAMPGALKRPGRISKQRLGRMKQALADARNGGRGPMQRAVVVAGAISQKLTNALLWEISQRYKRAAVRARFGLLRKLLARKLAWPKIVPELSVRQIYDSAEAAYEPKPASISSVVLVRAKTGEANDTPYQNIYADETFGWGAVAHGLMVVDVEGGHSSMLQEPFADSLATALMPYLQHKAEPARARPIEAAIV